MPQIVLASSSKYRKALLSRLMLEFETNSPDIDESRLEGESPSDLVARLSENKARAVQATYPNAYIIGSDQVAVLNNTILTKPGNDENARIQLSQASGNTVTFLTGVCVLYGGSVETDVISYSVKFRTLTDKQIRTYIDKEKPLDCAGSIKSEGLGIALFAKMQGDDPTALVGLPLIRLTRMLESRGFSVL